MTRAGSDRRRLTALDANASRRDLLKQAAALGLATPALAVGARQAGAAGGPGLHPALRAQEGQPQQGGTFVVLGHQEVSGLSPEEAVETVPWAVISQIHNGLYQLDENHELQPVLADSYELSDDGLTYTFKLKSGVTFHNGDPFTSADVKYTYEWIMNPDNASNRAGNFELVDSVEAPDETTVVVRLKETNVTFMYAVAQTHIYPASYHQEIGEQEYKAKPFGTGPFKLKEWNAAQRTVLEAFDDHFRGRPNFDEYRLDVVPEASGRMAALETGEADTTIWPLNSEDSVTLSESGEFTTYKWLQQAINHFPLNLERPFLNDKQARKAMMHAIDRQALIDDIFLGNAVLATSNLSPSITEFYTDDVVKYDYNVETANRLLDEAGWAMGDDNVREKEGQKATFTCFTITGDTGRRPEAEVVQQQLAEVGIDMQLQEAPVTAILDQLRAGEIDAALFNWVYGSVDADARDELKTGGPNNFFQFSNPRMDELLDAGIKELDPEKRVAIYHEVQQIVADEVPFLFIMVWNAFTFYNQRVQGLPESVVNGDQLILKAYQFWIEEGS
jgi:peptide/nickel transport system substrate-binding protein